MKAKFVYNIMKNDSTGYCVYRYRLLDTGKTITCTGLHLPVGKITYDLEIEETSHPTYGKQYKILSYTEIVGQNKEEIVDYIMSSFKGIGKKTAEKIYNQFKENTLDIIENNIDELWKIKGMTEKKIGKIKESMEQKKTYKDLYLFLIKYHYTSKIIDKIISAFKDRALDRIKNDPYILCSIKGINFSKVDVLREACGIEKCDDKRILAGSIQVLKENMLQGNVGMDRNSLTKNLYTLLELDYSYEDNEKFLWQHIVGFVKKDLLTYRKVFYNNNIIQYIYLNFMEKAERELSSLIIERLQSSFKHIPDIDHLIDKYSRLFGINLDISQRNGIKEIFTQPLIILTGGPGTGKTTLIKFITAINQEIYPDEPLEFMAPTGRAARRLSESVNTTAKTIHSRFSLKIQDEIQETYEETKDPITNGIVIVDEFSMVDLMLAHKLFSNIKNARVVLVGDENQLASIGPGNVLGDMIASGVVPIVRLSYWHRQEEGSLICENADKMQKGITTLTEGSEFQCFYMDDAENGQYMSQLNTLQLIENKMVHDYLSFYKNDKYRSIVCLCPYKQYPAGVYSLNQKIQDIINPLNNRTEFKGINHMVFRVGDPVMHLKNDDETLNGDLGKVVFIGKSGEKSETDIMVAAYDTIDGIINVEYTNDTIEDVTLAYAMTMHKSQGSEYDAVVSCLTDFHKNMLNCNILYTGVTRAKKTFHLYTSRKALEKAINNKSMTKRNTLLAYNLKTLYEANMQQMKLSL